MKHLITASIFLMHEAEKFTPLEHFLLTTLLQWCEKTGWVNPLQCFNADVAQYFGVSTNTLDNARKGLMRRKIIDYSVGGHGEPSAYRLVKLADDDGLNALIFERIRIEQVFLLSKIESSPVLLSEIESRISKLLSEIESRNTNLLSISESRNDGKKSKNCATPYINNIYTIVNNTTIVDDDDDGSQNLSAKNLREQKAAEKLKPKKNDTKKEPQQYLPESPPPVAPPPPKSTHDEPSKSTAYLTYTAEQIERFCKEFQNGVSLMNVAKDCGGLDAGKKFCEDTLAEFAAMYHKDASTFKEPSHVFFKFRRYCEAKYAREQSKNNSKLQNAKKPQSVLDIIKTDVTQSVINQVLNPNRYDYLNDDTK